MVPFADQQDEPVLVSQVMSVGNARPPADSNISTSPSGVRGKLQPLAKKAIRATSSSATSMNFTRSSTRPPTGLKASKPAYRKAMISKLRRSCRKRRRHEQAVITSGRGLASGKQRRDTVPARPRKSIRISVLFAASVCATDSGCSARWSVAVRDANLSCGSKS